MTEVCAVEFIELFLFLTCVGTAFALRFFMIPWDFGGFFFQCWFFLGGTFYFIAARYFPKQQRTVVRFIVLPIASFIVFGSLWFAVQSLFPFLLVTLAIASYTWAFPWPMKRTAPLITLLFIPILVAYCSYGVRHMMTIYRLKHLNPLMVRRIELTKLSENGSGTPIVLTSKSDIAVFASSLKSTTPYSPNHEGINKPWKVSLELDSGKTFSFEIGKGHRDLTETTWIEFGVEVYQNAALYDAVEHRLKLHLW